MVQELGEVNHPLPLELETLSALHYLPIAMKQMFVLNDHDYLSFLVADGWSWLGT